MDDTCKNCYEEVESDGHGGLVHSANLLYGCNPKAKRGGAYPVAE